METTVSIRALSPREFFAPLRLEDRFAVATKVAKRRITSNEAAYAWLDWLTAYAGDISPEQVELLLREALLLSPNQPIAQQIYGGLMRPAQAMPKGSLVFMVTSCKKYLAAANSLRASLESHGQIVCIVVGDAALSVKQWHDNICILPVGDEYEYLPLKVGLGINAIVQRFGLVSVVKMDDDCRLSPTFSPELLIQLARNYDYVGELASNENMCRFWHHGKTSKPLGAYGRRNNGEWARGGWYLLSQRAASLVAHEICHFPSEFGDEYYEDKAMGDFLRRQQISLYPVASASVGIHMSGVERLLDSPTGGH